ncbi:MAG: S41 family peptidase [Litorimonas sp.]
MENRTLKRLFAVAVPLLLTACQNPEDMIEPTLDPVDISASDFDADAVWTNVRADFDLFYAYRDSRGFDADVYLDKVGALVSTATDREEFRRRLHRATFAFTDPHLGFGPRDAADFNTIPSASDLQIGYQDGRYSILDVRAGSAALAGGLRTGSDIVAVDGVPIARHVSAVFADFLDQPSDAQRAYAATLVANGRREGDRQIDVRLPDGTVQSVTLANPRLLAKDIMDSPAVETRRVTTPDGSNIAILRINNRLGDNGLITAFDAAMATVTDADGVILDLRNTPSGGNAEVGRSILGHFTAEVQPFQIHEVPSLDREFTVPRRFIEQVYPREPFFDPARTIVLGGYWTGSMGEGIVIGMDALGVHTIASDMGDLLGGMSNFSFDDNKITLSIPTETLFHVDGTPREDFVADVALFSADSDATGSDPALAAAFSDLATP